MVFSCFARRSSLKVLVALYMLWFLIFISEAAPTYLYHMCPNTTTYNPNSTYQVNLNSLLSTLSSNNTRNSLFDNATAGDAASVDRAYGLFMCRGDVAVDTCHDCVVNATREIVEKCPKEKEAYIWYDECMLRYDYESFFNTMEDRPSLAFMNTENVTDQDRLAQVLNNTMYSLAARASSNQSINSGELKGFATGETNLSSSETLYNLVQCTPDLSGADCQRCLNRAIGQLPACCSGSRGGRVILPSCNVRYEMYQFYDIAPAAAPSPAPAVPPPAAPRNSPPTLAIPPSPAPRSSASPRGNKKASAEVIIAVLLTVGVSILLWTNEVSLSYS